MEFNRSFLCTRRGLAVAVLAAAVVLTGCASTPPTSAPDRDSNGAEYTGEQQAASGGGTQGTARIDAGDQSFTFELALCMVSDEDVLAHGPGRNEATAEPAYLDIDFYTASGQLAGELRIDVGTDQQFDSSDDILVGDIGPDYDYGMAFNAEGSGFRLNTELRDGSSGQSFGPMDAVIECN